MKDTIEFEVLCPRQSRKAQVFTFVTTAEVVSKIARIERVSRDAKGKLEGFQRSQVAGHIRNIQTYLETPEAILPNPIILGFVGGALLELERGARRGRLVVDLAKGPPGWIVDGQQRFTALSGIHAKDFEILVSGYICESEAELKRQFMLVNKTRPLPKSLVNELVPEVFNEADNEDVLANKLLEHLNYTPSSSLYRQIKTHTNPNGVLKDSAIRKVISSSLTDGALRNWRDNPETLKRKGVALLSDFFHAVQEVFQDDWKGHKPTTSRLVHGVGVIAMGRVMEMLCYQGLEGRDEFADGLRSLEGHTAWTKGHWKIGGERRAWDGLEYTGASAGLLSEYLVDIVKRRRIAKSERKSRRTAASAPESQAQTQRRRAA